MSPHSTECASDKAKSKWHLGTPLRTTTHRKFLRSTQKRSVILVISLVFAMTLVIVIVFVVLILMAALVSSGGNDHRGFGVNGAAG